MEKLSNLLFDLKNIMFPDICPGCGHNILSKGRLICTECLFEMPFTDHFEVRENKVASHFYGRVPIEAAAGLVYFKRSDFVQGILHDFKYRGNKKAGITMGKMAGEKMLVSPYFRNLDIILPVPLHPEKEYIRGYNQSHIFAQGISSVISVPAFGDILVKVKKNDSQTGKNRMERLKNVAEVYRLQNPGMIQDKNVLLVDDVITTGSTLEACVHVLLQARPKTVSIVSLACAL